MRKALLAVCIGAGAAGLAAGFWLTQPPHRNPVLALRETLSDQPRVEIGSAMPALSLPTLDGQPLALPGAYAGRPLLINVWASWCGPCVAEMPELMHFSTAQGHNGVQVIGLALDTPEAVAEFLQRVPVAYPIVIDTPGPADASVALGNLRGLLPYSVLIDRHGRIAKKKLGPFAPGEIGPWATTD